MKPSSARMTHFLLCIYDVTGTKVLLYFIYSVPTKSHYDISMQYKCKYKKIIGGWFIFKRVAAMFICQESGRHVYLSREWPPCLFVKRLAAMFICQESGRHVYFSRDWPPCLFAKRVAAMFICQESGRHVYLSREWPTCLFVKRLADMLISWYTGGIWYISSITQTRIFS